jgi:NifU-like protein involved in Fe-S cluster formation
MDGAIIQYYRRLLQEDFPNSGELDHPSIFIEAIGEKLINCGNTGNYMQLFLQITENRIEDIRYLCSCEPVANVAVEILCILSKGKMLDELESISEDSFYRILDSDDEQLHKKAQGLLDLLREGKANYCTPKVPGLKDRNSEGRDINWDEGSYL